MCSCINSWRLVDVRTYKCQPQDGVLAADAAQEPDTTAGIPLFTKNYSLGLIDQLYGLLDGLGVFKALLVPQT